MTSFNNNIKRDSKGRFVSTRCCCKNCGGLKRDAKGRFVKKSSCCCNGGSCCSSASSSCKCCGKKKNKDNKGKKDLSSFFSKGFDGVYDIVDGDILITKKDGKVYDIFGNKVNLIECNNVADLLKEVFGSSPSDTSSVEEKKEEKEDEKKTSSSSLHTLFVEISSNDEETNVVVKGTDKSEVSENANHILKDLSTEYLASNISVKWVVRDSDSDQPYQCIIKARS